MGTFGCPFYYPKINMSEEFPDVKTMKIFLDSSDVGEITKAVDTGLIDGVTTNPTLMLQSGLNPKDVLSDISTLFGWDASISAEVSGDSVSELLEMADEYVQINPNITIKVPCTVDGLKVCNDLSADDIQVNVTLVFSVAQAILSAKAGASFVSPFVGRVDDNSFDGVELVGDIVKTFKTHGVDTQVLAASLRNVKDVSECFKRGSHVVTMPPKIFWKMYDHVLTEQGLKKFNEDWAKVMAL
jgi:transaldolase